MQAYCIDNNPGTLKIVKMWSTIFDAIDIVPLLPAMWFEMVCGKVTQPRYCSFEE